VTSAPSNAALREALERALGSVGLELTSPIERRPSPYRTSFPIEELRAELAGRGPVRLGCKRLDWEELEPEAQLAKPRFLYDPAREPAVYRALLSEAPPGAPEFFGAVVDDSRHWLFFEWVEGRELFQVGERELWEQAARWLARFHVAMAPELARHREDGRLIEHDAGFYRAWIERAEQFAARLGEDDRLAPRAPPAGGRGPLRDAENRPPRRVLRFQRARFEPAGGAGRLGARGRWGWAE
jgi:hypothetical protein